MLEKALRLAVEIHNGQKDLAGLPYILHPLRVMLKLDTELEMTIGVLHDVVENGGWPAIGLLHKANFPLPVYEGLKLLTRDKPMDYEAYIDQVMTSTITMKIKLADLEDNTDPERIAALIEQGMDPGLIWALLHKYKAAMARIRTALS